MLYHAFLGLKQEDTPMISEHIEVNYETRLASPLQDIYSEVYECEFTNAHRENKWRLISHTFLSLQQIDVMAKKGIHPHRHTNTATQESCNEIRLSIHQIRHTSA